MHAITPEERAAIELRMVALRTRMVNLDRLHKPENSSEWAALYEVREVLEKQLGENELLPLPHAEPSEMSPITSAAQTYQENENEGPNDDPNSEDHRQAGGAPQDASI